MWIKATEMAGIPPMTVIRVTGPCRTPWFVTEDWTGEHERDITAIAQGFAFQRNDVECWQEPRVDFPVVVYPDGRTIPLWQYHEEAARRATDT